MTEYTVEFNGINIFTTIADSGSAATAWIESIRYIHRFRLHKLVVGLGVQWRPTFTRAIRPRPATLQLCVGCRCLIFQLVHADYIPQELADFLQDPRFHFVGVGIRYDTVLLDTCGLYLSNQVELRYQAAYILGMSYLNCASMENLAIEVLNIQMHKPVEIGKSNWEDRWLSDEQLDYASIDAYVSFQLGKALDAREDDDDVDYGDY